MNPVTGGRKITLPNHHRPMIMALLLAVTASCKATQTTPTPAPTDSGEVVRADADPSADAGMSTDRGHAAPEVGVRGVDAAPIAMDATTQPQVFDSTLDLDRGTAFQTMQGWELVTFTGQLDLPEHGEFATLNANGDLVPPSFVSDTLTPMATKLARLGINRVRLEANAGFERTDFDDRTKQYLTGAIPRSEWKELWHNSVNDDGDPMNINWSGFNFAQFDYALDTAVIPLKTAVEANGDDLYVLLTYVDFKNNTPQSRWNHLWASADEYAEFILAHFLHLQNNYGFVPDGVEIKLEPDVGLNIPADRIADALVATAQRLESNGFTGVEFVAPSNTSMNAAIPFFHDMVAANPAVLDYLTEFAYHAYLGDTPSNRQTIAQIGRDHGIRTAQLEFWDSAHDMDFLWSHLSEANNSAYEFSVMMIARPDPSPNGLLTPLILDYTDRANPAVRENWSYWYMGQFTRYIKPGATRIATSAEDPEVQSMAFVQNDGGHTVIIRSPKATAISINDLPAGTYEISHVTGRWGTEPTSGQPGAHQIVTTWTISTGQNLIVSIPAAGIITVTSAP